MNNISCQHIPFSQKYPGPYAHGKPYKPLCTLQSNSQRNARFLPESKSGDEPWFQRVSNNITKNKIKGFSVFFNSPNVVDFGNAKYLKNFSAAGGETLEEIQSM